MFGRGPNDNHHGPPPRPAAAETARIKGGGLVQVIVTNLAPLTFYLFLNDVLVPQLDVDGLYVEIEAPQDDSEPTVQATLTRRVDNVAGQSEMQDTQLFPCTIELLARGRRVAVTCRTAGALDGVWIDLGLKPDGTGAEVEGAQRLQLVLNQDMLNASLTWNDGTTEDLLPEAAPA